MPTYEYICKSCRYHYEVRQRITDEKLTKCPNCCWDSLERGYGGGQAIEFKGDGFPGHDEKVRKYQEGYGFKD